MMEKSGPKKNSNKGLLKEDWSFEPIVLENDMLEVFIRYVIYTDTSYHFYFGS